jgi:hypothetical protein
MCTQTPSSIITLLDLVLLFLVLKLTTVCTDNLNGKWVQIRTEVNDGNIENYWFVIDHRYL